MVLGLLSPEINCEIDGFVSPVYDGCIYQYIAPDGWFFRIEGYVQHSRILTGINTERFTYLVIRFIDLTYHVFRIGCSLYGMVSRTHTPAIGNRLVSTRTKRNICMIQSFVLVSVDGTGDTSPDPLIPSWSLDFINIDCVSIHPWRLISRSTNM